VAVIGTAPRSELALPADFPADFPYIQLADSRRALAMCAAALYDFPSREMRVIGVTGTDGKTTTSTILESILVAATRCDEFPCLYAIVECTSHGLAQDRVSAIDFDVACVTNITHEHIDWHGSREAYIAAKALLFRMLFRADGRHGGRQRFAVLG